ncbi:type II toxin-antitoxin system HicA family toxin [Candidatus Uhrbacteria bacterium]|nr:type II toxin-antitoxin system HicA family toxin [Candidatus Uhrbacteria bacterium]
MPKLPLRAREIVKRLEKLGFICDHTSGSHMIFYHPTTKRRAVVPQHRGDLPKGTVKAILREAGIELKKF